MFFRLSLIFIPKKKNFLIEGRPSWATTVTDESITTEADMIKVLKEKVNPYPTVTFEVDYEELLHATLKGIEDQVTKGDTIHVLADTELNGITFEDDIRVTKVSYNPLDSTEAPELTIDGGEKDPVDLQVEQRKRIKDQRSVTLTTKRNLLNLKFWPPKKTCSLAIGETKNSLDSIPNTFSYPLRFTKGAWQVTTSDASVSIEGNTFAP
nr:phage tail protein [Bacillus licheniformis]